MENDAPQPAQPETNDKVIYGCGMGCLCQLAFILIGWFVATRLSDRSVPYVMSAWGVTQWIAIVPLILRQKANGKRRVVQGLLIIGGIGLLLSSACASLVLTILK